MDKKGQLFSGDIAIATMIFLFSLSMAFFLWDSVSSDINNAENLRSMSKMASEAIEQLIRNPGVPEDWNYFTVQVPGLATHDRVINETKALEFIRLMNSTNYVANKHLMGLGGYDFYLNVTDLDGNVVAIGNGTFITGRLPGNSGSDTVAMFRTAIFNGEVVRANFAIWK